MTNGGIKILLKIHCSNKIFIKKNLKQEHTRTYKQKQEQKSRFGSM